MTYTSPVSRDDLLLAALALQSTVYQYLGIVPTDEHLSESQQQDNIVYCGNQCAKLAKRYVAQERR